MSDRDALRLPFAYAGDLDGAELAARMRVADVELVKAWAEADAAAAEWRATEPTSEGSVVLRRKDDVSDLCIATFSGPRHVDLALNLPHVLAFVPEELLHLGARSAAHRAIRVGALSTLALHHDEPARWDTNAELTVDLVIQDEDRELRRRAIELALRARPALARRHLTALLESERDPEERGKLEALLSRVPLKTGRGAKPHPAPPLRPAFPTFADADTDEIVARLDSICDVPSRAFADFGGGADLVEFDARGFDAKMTYVVSRATRVGGVFFQGRDGLSMAFGVQRMLSYFPVALALAAVQKSAFEDYRVIALYALGMSQAKGVLPRESVDPRVSAAVELGKKDPSPKVRIAANQMAVFLEQ